MRGLIDHGLLDRDPIGQVLIHQCPIARSLIDGRRIAINFLGTGRCVLRIDGD